MADNKPSEAIELVATRVIQFVAWRHLDLEDDLWSEFPEIGEYDFTEVVEKAIELAGKPSTAQQEAAYEYLANRAEK